MTDINELTAKLKAAARNAISEEGETWWNEEQLASDYGLALHPADAKFIALASHANILALTEALEAAEKRIAELEALLSAIGKSRPGGAYFCKWDSKINEVLSRGK